MFPGEAEEGTSMKKPEQMKLCGNYWKHMEVSPATLREDYVEPPRVTATEFL